MRRYIFILTQIVLFAAVLISCLKAHSQTSPANLLKNILQTGHEGPNIPDSDLLNNPFSLNEMRRYQAELARVNNLLRRVPDTTEVSEFIPNVEAFANGINELLSKRKESANLRMIGSILNFIDLSERSLDKFESTLEIRLQALSDAKHNIDSIKIILFDQDLESHDQGYSKEYRDFVESLRTNITNTSHELEKQLTKTLELDASIQLIKLNLNELDTQLRFESHRIVNNIFSKEIPYLWQPLQVRDANHFKHVLKTALFFNSVILFKYLTAFRLSTITFLLLIALLIIWFHRTHTRTMMDEKNRELIFERTKYLSKFPKLSAALVLISLSVLFYPDPPMAIFSAGLLIAGSITGILLSKRVQKPVFIAWVVFYILFAFCLLSNLFWETVHEERYVIFFMSLIGMVLGLIFLYGLMPYRRELPKFVKYSVWIYIVVEFISLILNALGRFSLSKMLSVTATVSLMQAISLVIFVLIVKEFVYLRIELGKKKNSNPTSTNDYEKLQSKLVNIFSVVAIGLWLYYFLKNLHLLDLTIEETAVFLETPRSLHYATFSFGTVLTFFLTLFIANFIASNFTYFSEIRDRNFQGHRNKRFGSQILIVRLTIISTGFFIALAVAGIPMARITIVLGALSVGIGFGLQNIINNLVSGVILAFERPIQIGDTIDSGPDQGIVKEIGIRASKIRNWDGAEVVIPNGDLLANRLTNWTLNDKHRRVELVIGVSYNSDIDEVTRLITESLFFDGVLKWPAPSVYLQKLNESSLDFRVLFWVADVDLWIVQRDKAMREIFKSLKDNGIQIPFPQRDLHIRSVQGNDDLSKHDIPPSGLKPE